MPNTTPLAVELYQRAGDGLVPLLVRATGGDTTDIEALIAAAIKQHNEDPEAHPDIRQAIKEAGGGLVTTPVLSLAQRLPVGFPAELGMTAVAGLNGAHVQSFRVTVNNAEPVTVAATDNAATYTFTPTGNAGDTLTVGVTAVDNFGNRSPEATEMGVLYESIRPVYAGKMNTGLYRSFDKGLVFEAISSLPNPSIQGLCTSQSGEIVFICTIVDSTLSIYKSVDYGDTWNEVYQKNGVNSIYSFAYTQSVLIVCYYNKAETKRDIAISKDKGITWTEACPNRTFKNIVEGENGRLFSGANESNNVYYSNDAGLTWKFMQTGMNKSIYFVAPVSENKIFVGGIGGETTYTQDGGNTWSEWTQLRGNIHSMRVAYDKSIILTGAASSSTTTNENIYRSVDGGVKWTLQKASSVGQIWAIAAYPDGLVIAGGMKGSIQRSTDHGVTWGPAITTGLSVVNFLA